MYASITVGWLELSILKSEPLGSGDLLSNPYCPNSTDTIWNPQLSTRSLNSFLALKNGRRFDLILTCLPVLGFRPVYDRYFLTKNEHNPRISNRPPFARARVFNHRLPARLSRCFFVPQYMHGLRWPVRKERIDPHAVVSNLLQRHWGFHASIQIFSLFPSTCDQDLHQIHSC